MLDGEARGAPACGHGASSVDREVLRLQYFPGRRTV